MIKTEIYRDYCRQRQEEGRFRHLEETVTLSHGRALRGGQRLVNCASNDYLGLSQHPALVKAAVEAAHLFGAGATASRLIVGNLPLYREIEEKIVAAKGHALHLAEGEKASALLLATGYQANATVIAALADEKVAGRPVTVVADKLAHHSLLQGAALAGAKCVRFVHNDYTHLRALLAKQKAAGALCLVVTESIFGMDGDCADLAILREIATEYEALLYVDEAHATGVWGPQGYGLTAAQPGCADIVMGTFGKGLGVFGAYILCAPVIRDYLVQRCGGLIYSTALPPMVLGAINAAWDLLPHLQTERAHLHRLCKWVRDELQAKGWDCGKTVSQIIPVIVGSAEAATRLSRLLMEKGFLVPAIRPPTVPPQQSRLRISLNAALAEADMEALLETMKVLRPQFSAIG